MTIANPKMKSPKPILKRRKPFLKISSIKGKSTTDLSVEILPKKKKIRVLSIDGGGMRGIIPATILVYLENQLIAKTGNSNARISDFFDLVAGTSTGGILACTYLLPHPDQPKISRYTAQEVLDMYLKKKGCGIFKRSFWRKWNSLMGFFKEKYSTENLENALQKCLGQNTLFCNLIKPCMVTAYDIQQRKPKLFKSFDSDASHYPVWKVCRATAAAPTLFQPAVFISEKGKKEVLADGGLFAPNPAMYAYTATKNNTFSKTIKQPNYKNLNQEQEIMIVSLGTGIPQTPHLSKHVQSGGTLAWVRPMLNILLSAGSESVDEQLSQLLNQENKKYYRLNPSLKRVSSQMDDISDKNLEALHQVGLDYIQNHKEELDIIIHNLVNKE